MFPILILANKQTSMNNGNNSPPISSQTFNTVLYYSLKGRVNKVKNTANSLFYTLIHMVLPKKDCGGFVVWLFIFYVCLGVFLFVAVVWFFFKGLVIHLLFYKTNNMFYDTQVVNKRFRKGTCVYC